MKMFERKMLQDILFFKKTKRNKKKNRKKKKTKRNKKKNRKKKKDIF